MNRPKFFTTYSEWEAETKGRGFILVRVSSGISAQDAMGMMSAQDAMGMCQGFWGPNIQKGWVTCSSTNR